MMLPQNFIEEVKEKTCMVELAKEYTELRRVSGEVWQGRCPHPKHEDEDPSFTVWKDQQTWCCYGCHVGKRDDHENFGSDCIAFVRWMKNLSFVDSIVFLANRLDLPLPDNQHMALYNKNKEIAKIYQKSLLSNNEVMDYIYSRGLDITDINNWMLGYDGCSVTLPLFDRYRNVQGFSIRRFRENDRMNKYKNPVNSEVFNKSSYLYGLHNVDTSFKEIRISEGPFDAIIAHKHGIKNVVALQGTSLTDDHAKVISKLKLVPTLCFDGDPSGKKGMLRAIKVLTAHGMKPNICVLPNNFDLADLSTIYKGESEEYIVEHSTNYSQYLMSDIMVSYEAKVNELKSNIAPQVKAVLSLIEDDDERFVLENYIKDRTGLDFNRGGINNDMRRLPKQNYL